MAFGSYVSSIPYQNRVVAVLDSSSIEVSHLLIGNEKCKRYWGKKESFRCRILQIGWVIISIVAKGYLLFISVLTICAVCWIYRCSCLHSCCPMVCFIWLVSGGSSLLWMENKHKRKRFTTLTNNLSCTAYSLHLYCSVIIWTSYIGN